MFSIGYYGRPGVAGSDTKVHIHNARTHRPACNATLRPDQEYQWCSHDNVDYLECKSCKRIAAKLVAAAPPDVRRAFASPEAFA